MQAFSFPAFGPRPRRFLAPLLVCLAAGLTASAAAEAGAVELSTGERLEGAIEAVLPGDRVLVRLRDGDFRTVPWTLVRFVFDGARVYDAAGNWTFLPTSSPSPPVPTPTPPVQAAGPAPFPLGVAFDLAVPPGFDPVRPGSFGILLRANHVRSRRYANLPMTNPLLFEHSLPGVGGTAVLGTMGGIVLSGSLVMLGFGAALTAFDGGITLICSFVPLTSSVVMLRRTRTRSRIRQVGRDALLLGLIPMGPNGAPGATFGGTFGGPVR